MPLYDYKCTKCDYKFTLLRKVEEARKFGKCPNCGAPGKRQLSTFSFDMRPNKGKKMRRKLNAKQGIG